MNLLNSKKGQVRNYLVVVTFLFTFAVITIMAMVIASGMRDAWISSGQYTGAVEEAGEKFYETLKVYDKLMVVLLSVLIIAVAISSFKLNASPVFMVISVIMIPFLGFVSFFFNFMFVQVVGNPAFDAVRVFFPITILICTNLHWVALAAFVIGSITLYGKRPKEELPETLG